MTFADLHLHTRQSDGTYSPEELVAAAHAQGLSLIAVTDHDTMEACATVRGAAASLGIEFIPGTEITAELHGRELHILGYFLNPDNAPLRKALARAQGIRQNRIREMVDRLNANNVPLAVETVFALANCSAPGRPHVARALVQGGFCASMDEAFERYLKKDRPGWVPKEKMSAAQAVELIHAAGGLAVMAHPGLNHDDSLVGKVARLGADGLECFHPKHPPAATQKYLALARKFSLLVTGGSDCHGTSKNRPTIGTVKLPMEYVEALRARHTTDRPAPGATARQTATP